MKDLFNSIIKMLKSTAPISITINIILGIILLIIGIWMFKTQSISKTKYIICFSLSGLFFVGALSTTVVNYLI
ncbi:hypothetical protein [Miniphocaeibacter halophilus]|uniref:Uncharacterized protein n=1 Tax=Miniphocaeibacter halophilus TaxID=2931922 RepID=A0AC61MZ74_9FIRM|nr:hypothetical protein [Miniphocaeibacter halophilus]QQK08820.1 hypothetical protein JFY71_04610 [Miniphocaeibacter halophilus]